MAITLNQAEHEAYLRNTEGIFDEDASTAVESVTLERRDSLNNSYEDGFLILHIAYVDGGWAEDAVSETGSTSFWAQKA